MVDMESIFRKMKLFCFELNFPEGLAQSSDSLFETLPLLTQWGLKNMISYGSWQKNA